MAAALVPANLVKDELTTIFRLDPLKNSTIGVYSKAGNVVGAQVRIDASWDGGVEYVNSISLSDPTAAVGAAFVTVVATGKTGLTQDRVFGATHVRVVRTDAGAAACLIAISMTTN